MPRLPKQIIIGAHTYTLLLRKRVFHKLKGKRRRRERKRSTQCDGLIDYDKEIIYLDKKFIGPNKYLVLWHEVFHGITAAAGWKYNEQETEELSKILVQVLMDNPGIIPPPRRRHA